MSQTSEGETLAWDRPEPRRVRSQFTQSVGVSIDRARFDELREDWRQRGWHRDVSYMEHGAGVPVIVEDRHATAWDVPRGRPFPLAESISELAVIDRERFETLRRLHLERR